MRILVEGYPYELDLLKTVIPDSFIQISKDNKTGIINYVGYYRIQNGISTMILPKVFVNPKDKCLFGIFRIKNS